MKFLLKLLCAPIIAVLSLFIWICTGLLNCTTFVFGLASTLLSLLGLAVLATYSVKNGIILLVIAFLVSPVGLPMFAVHLLGCLQSIVNSIKAL